jgi:hypothetical protein
MVRIRRVPFPMAADSMASYATLATNGTETIRHKSESQLKFVFDFKMMHSVSRRRLAAADDLTMSHT